MQIMSEPRVTSCAPMLFFFLHVCTAWPVGVVGLALGSSLVKAGVPVQQTATIITASTLAFTVEFLWAPIVDSSFTRRTWYLAGATMMCACLAMLLDIPSKGQHSQGQPGSLQYQGERLSIGRSGSL